MGRNPDWSTLFCIKFWTLSADSLTLDSKPAPPPPPGQHQTHVNTSWTKLSLFVSLTIYILQPVLKAYYPTWHKLIHSMWYYTAKGLVWIFFGVLWKCYISQDVKLAEIVSFTAKLHTCTHVKHTRGMHTKGHIFSFQAQRGIKGKGLVRRGIERCYYIKSNSLRPTLTRLLYKYTIRCMGRIGFQRCFSTVYQDYCNRDLVVSKVALRSIWKPMNWEMMLHINHK